MSANYDFIVVGGGSAGAVIASRLTEDPGCRVALLEAGGHPPDAELLPGAVASLQLNPETDWMYTASAGKGGLGAKEPGTMVVPRGKMLGGCSGINYMAYVRGNPSDYDTWADDGASGWRYQDVLPYFRKSERLTPTEDAPIDEEAHGKDGPMGVSIRKPIVGAAKEFVTAAVESGIPVGDYNGAAREGTVGVVSLFQTTTTNGKRTSTYRAFLDQDVLDRDNLTVLTHAHVTQVTLHSANGRIRATGVEYRSRDGGTQTISATKEVILSAGAIGSPHLLLLSGIGPQDELGAFGISSLIDNPHVGKHLQDHLHTPLLFASPGCGVQMLEFGMSMGPDALRAPQGPLPANPAEDGELPEELQALKAEAERRIAEWATTGEGLASSSLYDAAAWIHTGVRDDERLDAQISIVVAIYPEPLFSECLSIDTDRMFDDKEAWFSPETEGVMLLASPVLPKSEGQVRLQNADPMSPPQIELNYYDNPDDVRTMVVALHRALDIADNWPSQTTLGPVMIPPFLADKHRHRSGDRPSDALLEDLALHYAVTVYHETSTCRMGDVVDSRLKVMGTENLRVADASVMPTIVAGNTNAAAVMIGEKASEIIAREHGVNLRNFVGEPANP